MKMRFRILKHTSERLLRNVAIVLTAGLAAGCSADTSRFSDGFFASAVPSGSQQYSSGQSVDGGYTGSVASVAPVAAGNVQRNELPPVAQSSTVVAAASSMAQPAVQQIQNAQGNNSLAQGAAAAAASMVTVQPGQSLYGIATKYGVSTADLMRINGITDANAIQAGQNLKLPSASTVLASASTAVTSKVNETVTNAQERVLGQIPASAAQAANGTYQVQTGDSLYSIAQKNNVSLDALKQANGLSNGAIRVGQALVLPAAGAAVVAETANKPAAPAVKQEQVQTAALSPNAGQEAASNTKPYTPPQSSNKVIEDAQKDASIAPSSTGISQLRWPVRGKVLSGFGQREGSAVNDGMDIMVPEGTSVKAAENGVVIYAGDGLKEFGNTVLIRHDNGLVTVYGHNSTLNVQRGQKVRRGDEVARSGMSGNAKSPKLHFEVRQNSTPVNPTKYLES